MIRVSLMLWLLVGLLAAGWGTPLAELCSAAGSGDLAKVRALLLTDPQLVSHVDYDTLQTPLAVAARRGQADVVAYLLQHGALVNQRGEVDNRELPPLLHAAETGQTAVLTLLLQHGAELSALDHNKADALWLAMVNDHPESVRVLLEHGMTTSNRAAYAIPLLRYARLHGLSAALIRVLVEHDAHDSTDYFYTATPAPYLDAGVAGMVPLAPFADWCGARVEHAASGALRITLQNRTVTFTLGQRAAGYGMTVAGKQDKQVTLPAAPVERDGFVYLPVSVFIDGLGLVADWSDRWLQAKLHHPSTGEILTVGLADPDAPDVKAVRAVAEGGPYPISEVTKPDSADYPVELFVLEHGTLHESETLKVRPNSPLIKCYGLTRYLGVGNYTFTGNKVTFSPVVVSGTVTGITGGWNAMPRAPHREDPSTPLYQQTIRALLQEKHMGNVPVKIDQAFTVDLNGDGRKTLLLSGTYENGDRASRHLTAYYNFAGIWSVTGDTLQQQRCDGQFLTEPTDCYLHESFSGMLDVNGDGAMEIIMAGDSGWGSRTAYASTPTGLLQLATVQWGE